MSAEPRSTHKRKKPSNVNQSNANSSNENENARRQSLQPARTRGPAYPSINWARGLSNTKQTQKIRRGPNQIAPSEPNPVNKRLFHTPEEHHYRTRREHDFRKIESEFKIALAAMHQDMHTDYQMAAKESEDFKQIAKKIKENMQRKFEANRSDQKNEHITALQIRLKTELAAQDEIVANLVRERATQISTVFDKKIKEAHEALEIYMTRANEHWDQKINAYFQRLQQYNDIDYEERMHLAAILQKHANELQQLAGKKVTKKGLEVILVKHRQEIQQVKDHFHGLKLQFQGGRQKTRRYKKH